MRIANEWEFEECLKWTIEIHCKQSLINDSSALLIKLATFCAFKALFKLTIWLQQHGLPFISHTDILLFDPGQLFNAGGPSWCSGHDGLHGEVPRPGESVHECRPDVHSWRGKLRERGHLVPHGLGLNPGIMGWEPFAVLQLTRTSLWRCT